MKLTLPPSPSARTSSLNELFCAGSSSSWSPVPVIALGRGTIPTASAFIVRGASAAVCQSTALPGVTGLSAALKSADSGTVPSTTFTPIWNGSVQPAASYARASGRSG